MKKIFKVLLLILFLILSYFLFNRFYRFDDLPHFQYETTSGQYFKNKDLNKDKATVFIYYSTDCTDCKGINTCFELFKAKEETINFILIAQNTQKENIVGFLDVSQLATFRGRLLIDKKNNFPSDFSLGIEIGLPTILYYNKEGKFVKQLGNYEELKEL